MCWTYGADLGWGRRPKLHDMQGVKARIGLAVPGRSVRSLSRGIGAPWALVADCIAHGSGSF